MHVGLGTSYRDGFEEAEQALAHARTKRDETGEPHCVLAYMGSRQMAGTPFISTAPRYVPVITCITLLSCVTIVDQPQVSE